MRLAQVEDGIVVNVAEVDPAHIPEFMQDWVVCEDAGPGWLWDGENFTQPLPPPPTQQDLFEEIKVRRDRAISSGITVSGYQIHTDETSQTRVMGAAVAAMLDPEYSVQWKTASGEFVSLDAASVIGIASAVRAHVQACFDREAELCAAVVAGESYDIEEGWPE